VPSFHNESGNYWFRLQVSYIPDDVSSSAFTLSLYRTYDDFYEFQISLLDTFPFEAGRPAKGEENRAAPERILPYMPGPVDGDEVDDELTEYRREELDAYVKALIDLRLRGAGYILRHELFRGFFAAKYGDYCEEVPRESVPRPEVVEELDERMGNMRVTDEPTQYIVDTRATSAASRHSQPHTDRDQQSPQSWGQSASRGASSRGPSPLPLIETQQVHAGGRPESSGYAAPHSASVSGHSHGHAPGHHAHGSGSGPVAASTPTSAGPGPSAGQQPSYIKIKIYDRTTDDLIAIRVHPSVSHAELFDKVRARLGPDIQVLRYRTGMAGGAGGAYKDLRDDRELREWLRIEDQKLVLYAEQ
jgi:bud emergence protein 1